MSTTITSDEGIEFEVCHLGVNVTDHHEQEAIWARLSDAQRIELAAALDPGRRGLHVRLDNQAATLATYRRELDEAYARAEQAENARDTAATRAKQLEREVSKVEGRASEWSIKAQEWQDRAEAAEARTAVTREDVEKVVHGSGGGFFDSRLDAITDAVCDLFGVEAEQAVDPVDEKARELYLVATPDARWETVADEYRAIAAHVLGQEADQ